MYVAARLSEEQVRQIQQYEQDNDTLLIALKEIDTDPAALEPDKIQELRELEQKLGKILLAVK